MVLLYPLAGWIADVYFGRYKVIRHCIMLMWVTMTTTTVMMALHYYHHDNRILADIVNYGVFPLAIVIMNLGLAGFKANIIPFGTDQLMDAPSDQLSAYVHWFVWTLYFSVALDTYAVIFIPLELKMLALVQALFQTACLSVAVASDFIFGAQWLLVEPGSRNPLKNVLQVLKYTAKHKYPVMRSAFTYGEISSRIDFAKQKYGGRFTTEQVEDVKTFLRIVLVLFAMFGYFVNNVAAFRVIEVLSEHVDAMRRSIWPEKAKLTTSATNVSSNTTLLVIFIAIPIYEFVIYPLFYRLVPSMLKRIGAGMVIVLASLVVQSALDVAAHLIMDGEAPCIFANITQMQLVNHSSMNTSVVQYSIHITSVSLYIPRVLNSVAIMLVAIGMFEFICAQSPYAMKGLLIGMSYCSNGVFLAVGVVIRLAFKFSYRSSEQTCPKFPSCGFLYYLPNMVIMVLGIGTFFFVVRAYRKRKREDVGFQQTVAENICERNLTRSQRSSNCAMR